MADSDLKKKIKRYGGQAKMARDTGVSRAAINAYANGRLSPTIDSAARIVLGTNYTVRFDDLIQDRHLRNKFRKAFGVS